MTIEFADSLGWYWLDCLNSVSADLMTVMAAYCFDCTLFVMYDSSLICCMDTSIYTCTGGRISLGIPIFNILMLDHIYLCSKICSVCDFLLASLAVYYLLTASCSCWFVDHPRIHPFCIWPFRVVAAVAVRTFTLWPC